MMSDFDYHFEVVPHKRSLRQRISRYLPFILFIATVFTTFFAGALMQFVSPEQILSSPSLLWKGAPFSVPLMTILLAHEMGHYLTSRLHRVRATLPYFIPFPNYIGTFGAIIKMKSPIRDRRALLDIGASGPLAGFVLSVIAAAWGLSHAEVIHVSQIPEGYWWFPRIAFGPNLAFALLGKFFAPHGGGPEYLLVNPLMDAGWLGMFVTCLNLMPAGQLDGGHIVYAVLGGKWALRLAKIVVGLCVILGLPGFLPLFFPEMEVMLPVWPGWLVWGVLIMVIGLGHPPPLHPGVRLDRPRKAIGIICLLVWLVTFTPVPFLPY